VSGGPPAGDPLRGRVAALIRAIAPEASPSSPCPYLPGRKSRILALRPERLGAELYQAFLDLNFRRLGDVVYRPACDGCRECRQLRVDVRSFTPSRTQRRCRRRNADLVAEVGPPAPSEEKLEVYRRYLSVRHDGQMSGTREEYLSFIHEVARFSSEVVFRDGTRRMVGAGIFDETAAAISAVYFYFDPDLAARSPGVYNVLWLIDECARRSLPWLYLGYFVRGAPTMEYKSAYRPHQLLSGEEGEWR
jgi:arginyl-tRNA--protein-N-Asp/Glu arginylyltransferase